MHPAYFAPLVIAREKVDSGPETGKFNVEIDIASRKIIVNPATKIYVVFPLMQDTT